MICNLTIIRMFTSAGQDDYTAVLAFLHRSGKTHEIRTVNGIAVSFKGFHHCKTTDYFMSSFKAFSAPKNDPSCEYFIAFTPNKDGAAWTAEIGLEDDEKIDFHITTFQDIVNAVSVFCD